jgi:hypothetical protein
MAISKEEEKRLKEEVWKQLPAHYKIMRKFWEETPDTEPQQETSKNETES